MPFMWADTLQAAERAHLLRLFVWAAASILCGTGVLAFLRAWGHSSALLRHFALQSATWGTVVALFAARQFHVLAPRDVGSATRLDRMLWFFVGLDVGAVMLGLVLVAVGLRVGRRMTLVGAGMGIVVQGCALALLDLILAGQISR